MAGYKEVYRREPGRELYVIHTDHEALDITELHWFGIRRRAMGAEAGGVQ